MASMSACHSSSMAIPGQSIPSMGKISVTKGKTYERATVSWLSDLLGVTFKRVPGSGAMHQIFDWDVFRAKMPGERATLLDDVGIECKNEKGLPVFIANWIDQCKATVKDSGKWKWFLAFHNPHDAKEYVILSREYFSNIIRELDGYQQESWEHNHN